MITMDNFRTALLISLVITIYGIGLSSAFESCKIGGEISYCPGGFPICLINKDGTAGGCVEKENCTLSSNGNLICNTEKCCCKVQDNFLCNDPVLNKDIICAEGALKKSAKLCKGHNSVKGPVTCNTGNGTEECLSKGTVCISDLKGEPLGCGTKANCTTDDKKKVTANKAQCSVETNRCCCINSPTEKPCNYKNNTVLSKALPGDSNGVEGLKAWRYNLVVSVVASSFALKVLIN